MLAERAFDLILASLATWRLASLIANEDGPFEIFALLRYRLGVRYDPHSRRYGTNALARGLVCLWCVSVWLAALTALTARPQSLIQYGLYVMAISAIAIWLDKKIR